MRISEDFAHSIVVLKQANNVKYAQFVEPGQTLSVTAEVLKFDEGEVKLKAYGTVSGRIIVTSTPGIGVLQPCGFRSTVRIGPTYATRQGLAKPIGNALPTADGEPQQPQCLGATSAI